FSNLVATTFFAENRRIHIDRPAIGSVRNLERSEYPVVELVSSAQHLVDQSEKSSRLSPLDNPVIVGAGDDHRLADPQSRQGFGRHRMVLGRIFNSPGSHDRSLARHEPW